MNTQQPTTAASKPGLRPQGADPLPGGGVRHRVWAPDRQTVEALVYGDDRRTVVRAVPLEKDGAGFFGAVDPEGRAGETYRYRLDGGDAFPDPFSRYQPEGVFGPSMVVDPLARPWETDVWPRRSLEETVIYELHVGTFTPGGTFRDAIAKLDHLAGLGVTTLEIMPLAAFPGSRNWGYDGVMLFAPDDSYGHPDDLRALIDAAHARGLHVWLDLVYNHFGPDGNFLSLYSPWYFNKRHKTPWGDAINFDGENHGPVREIFLANAAYWMDEFRFDGFRLDATHAILDDSPTHLLTEIARVVHERGGLVVAEDERNDAKLALPENQGGYGLDGLWADDFHHSVRVALTGDQSAWFANFTGAPAELADILTHGWHYRGQATRVEGTPRGTSTEDLRPAQCVHCVTNHDQTGNRAFGERPNHLVSPAAHRAACALLCFTPGTPLLFMGQEWGAASPFLFFTEHQTELGEAVTRGRREEFTEFFAAAGETRGVETIPDPQAEKTFLDSKLRWEETGEFGHKGLLLLHRACLALRRKHPAWRERRWKDLRAEVLPGAVTALRFGDGPENALLLLADLRGGGAARPEQSTLFELPGGWTWRAVLSSNETRFGGGESSPERRGPDILFTEPEVLLLQATFEQ